LESERNYVLKGKEEKKNPKYKYLLSVNIITGQWQKGLV